MSVAQFNTISSDLQELAHRARNRYTNLGYSVKVEELLPGFPFTPALLCKRNQTVIIVEVGREDVLHRTKQWTSYCKSSGRDMRLCLVLPQQHSLKRGDEESLRTSGVGLLTPDNGGFTEVMHPADLALSVELPDISGCSARGRKCLGPAYEHFSRREWREGFEAACLALEEVARNNLRLGLKSGVIALVGKKGVIQLDQKAIRKATMGTLKNWYLQIQSPRQVEVVLVRALRSVLPDRNRLTHHKHKAYTEQTLRSRVGRHMWTITDAIRIVTK